MKTLAAISLTAAALLTAPVAEAKPSDSAWQLDAAHTAVSFKVRHLAVSYTRGRFTAVPATSISMRPK